MVSLRAGGRALPLAWQVRIAMLNEAGHPEPWIIALSDPPSPWQAHDYGIRWGMFSDFKRLRPRGQPRLDRLLLVLSLALYVAVSTGMWDRQANPNPAEKEPRRHSPAASLEA